MENYFKLLYYDLQKIWRSLDLPQKATTIALIGLTIFAISYFAGKATEPNWSLLYSDLNETDAIAVVEHIKQAGYTYKLSDDKRSVFVPANLKEELRIEVAEADIIQDSNPGFELLDKMNFGATDFHNQMTKQRIYQDEITRTIEKISGVRKARVQIAEPERSVFADKDEDPSASVMLILEPGYKLKTEQIKAIKNLVAYAVPRLKPERVFLSNQRGDSLSDDISKSSNDIESFRTGFEKEKAEKITKVLETIVGKENVSVQVSAKMNFDSARATIESYVPAPGNNSALSSSAEEKEIYDAGKSTAENQAANATTEADKKKMNYSKTKTSTNYNVSKEVKQVVYAPGTVEKMTIAVALNKVLTPEEKTELTNLVMSASGAEPARGDVINITSMEFSGPGQNEVIAQKILEETEKQGMMDIIVSKIVPFLVVLILGVMALATINNLIRRPLDGQALGDTQPISLDEEVAGLLDVDTMTRIETQLDPQLEKMKTEINDIVLSDPQEAARLLLTFIKD